MYILSLDLVGAHGDVGEAVVEVPEDCLLAHRALQGLQVGVLVYSRWGHDTSLCGGGHWYRAVIISLN